MSTVRMSANLQYDIAREAKNTYDKANPEREFSSGRWALPRTLLHTPSTCRQSTLKIRRRRCPPAYKQA